MSWLKGDGGGGTSAFANAGDIERERSGRRVPTQPCAIMSSAIQAAGRPPSSRTQLSPVAAVDVDGRPSKPLVPPMSCAICCPGNAAFYAAVTTTIRLRFDGRSTAYQRSSRSQWRNPLTLTCLFIRAAVQQPTRGRDGRNVGRRTVVARSNCSRIVVES